MTTEEIINQLKSLREDSADHARHEEPGSVWHRDAEALTAAIQAVKLLEQIKADTRGNCLTCAYIKRDTSDVPCLSCFNGEVSGWGFRWPLGGSPSGSSSRS